MPFFEKHGFVWNILILWEIWISDEEKWITIFKLSHRKIIFFPDPARRARSGEKNEFPVRLFYHYKKRKSSIFWGWTTPAKMSDFERFSNFTCFYCPISFLTSLYIHSNYDFGGGTQSLRPIGEDEKNSEHVNFWDGNDIKMI